MCVCESCWALRSGDAEFRPDRHGARCGSRASSCRRSCGRSSGSRSAWRSSCTRASTDCIVALYPSPAGATESELHFETWDRLGRLNPVLGELEPDAEALIVNRMADPPQFAIAPIDRCYMLVGLVKARWEGISGGAGRRARRSRGYFDELREGGGVSQPSRRSQAPVAPEPEFAGARREPGAATPPSRRSTSTCT